MLNSEGQMKPLQSTWDPEILCATSHLDLELDAVANESSNLSWLPESKIDMMQFDISNIDLQNKIFSKATDEDSVSTFQPNQNHPHQSSIISSLPNKTDNENSTKASHKKNREFVDSDDDNRTSNEVESSFNDPL